MADWLAGSVSSSYVHVPKFGLDWSRQASISNYLVIWCSLEVSLRIAIDRFDNTSRPQVIEVVVEGFDSVEFPSPLSIDIVQETPLIVNAFESLRLLPQLVTTLELFETLGSPKKCAIGQSWDVVGRKDSRNG